MHFSLKGAGAYQEQGTKMWNEVENATECHIILISSRRYYISQLSKCLLAKPELFLFAWSIYSSKLKIKEAMASSASILATPMVT